MKKYPFLEAIGTADEKFLEEVFEDKENERRQISMSKKKLVTIMIAAALVVAIGATTAAASWNRLNQIGSFFDWLKDAQQIPDEVPIINDPEVYAKEVNTNVTTAADDDTAAASTTAEVKSYTPPAPGTAQITSVSATARSIYVAVEFNAAGLDIPPELPEDARHDAQFQFEWPETNFIWTSGGGADISRDGDIFTYVFHWDSIYEFPEDEIVIKLQRFGYMNADKYFVTLHDIEVEARLPVDEINFMESIKSKNSIDIMGIEHTAELSAYEFLIWYNDEDLIANGIKDENGYCGSDERVRQYNDAFNFSMGAELEYHMTDGTVFIEHLFTNEFGASHLIGSMGGAKDADTGASAVIYTFEVPLDISQIDYIVMNGYRFDFAADN